MSDINSKLRDALYASMEGSNLPVPRFVDLESEIDGIDSEIESLREDRKDFDEVTGTTSTLENYLQLLEKEGERVSKNTISVVQLGIESLFDEVSTEYSFEDMGLSEGAPDVEKFRSFVTKMKLFVKQREAELSDRIQSIGITIIPLIKEMLDGIGELKIAVNETDQELSLSEGFSFSNQELNYENLDIGTARVEDPSEILSRYRTVLRVLEDDWYPVFAGSYGSIVESWKSIETKDTESFRTSIDRFLVKHPPVMDLIKTTDLNDAFDQIGIVYLTTDPQTIKLRNTWADKSSDSEKRLVEFINDSETRFDKRRTCSKDSDQTIAALSKFEIQSVLSEMEEDLRFILAKERVSERFANHSVDCSLFEDLSSNNGLGNGQRQLFNELSFAVYRTLAIPVEQQVVVLSHLLKTYSELILLAQLSLKSHRKL